MTYICTTRPCCVNKPVLLTPFVFVVVYSYDVVDMNGAWGSIDENGSWTGSIRALMDGVCVILPLA